MVLVMIDASVLSPLDRSAYCRALDTGKHFLANEVSGGRIAVTTNYPSDADLQLPAGCFVVSRSGTPD